MTQPSVNQSISQSITKTEQNTHEGAAICSGTDEAIYTGETFLAGREILHLH